MRKLIITEGATLGLERCRSFLRDKNPHAMKRAGDVIEKHLALLQTEPLLGRAFEDMPELHELIIPFGDSGYVVLYRYELQLNTLYLLAFRHQKEAGYS